MNSLSVAETVERLAALQRRAMAALIERRRQWAEGLPTHLQERVLFATRERGTLPVSEVAELLDVAGATASQLLTVMEGRGWLRRAMVPEDRRRHEISLTEAGTGIVAEIEARRRQRLAVLLASLSGAERAQLVALAQRLADVLDAQGPAPGGGAG